MGAGKLSGTTVQDGLTVVPRLGPHPSNDMQIVSPSPPLSPHVNVEVEQSGVVPDEQLCPPVPLDACNVTCPNDSIADLYSLGAMGSPITSPASEPFRTIVCLRGPQGERVRFLATVDNGAMINALDATAYENTQNRLAQLSPSSRSLRMADGSLMASLGVWSGTLEWGQAKCTTSFEVFPSGGSW